MKQREPSHELRRCAWESAWVLREEFSELMTIEQNIKMEVVRMVEPERLGWDEIGDAMVLYARLVSVRV